MKILKESKEELPISFLTDFISRSWQEVGNIKENIRAISEEFKGTKKIEKVLQNLIDAYLVCIGQLEGYLDKKDYIDLVPADDLKEDLNIYVTTSATDDEPVQVTAEISERNAGTEPKTAVKPAEGNECEIIDEPKENNSEPEAFEFYCDFEEPDVQEPIEKPDYINIH